jgi:sulfatase modifying factor 1
LILGGDAAEARLRRAPSGGVVARLSARAERMNRTPPATWALASLIALLGASCDVPSYGARVDRDGATDSGPVAAPGDAPDAAPVDAPDAAPVDAPDASPSAGGDPRADGDVVPDPQDTDGGSAGVDANEGNGECGPATPGMVCIPQGTFTMGTDDSAFTASNSSPAHTVAVKAFQMDITEVTVRAYRACVEAIVCPPADQRNDDAGACTYVEGLDAYPVDCVSRDDAANYCGWLGKRLPSEEEWEYAAQHPDGRLYPWGDRDPSVTLLDACGLECDPSAFPWNDGYFGTAPVGSFPDGKTFDGLLDMAGNAWEWTANGNCDYPSAPCNACDRSDPSCMNPCNTCVGFAGVARGGGSGGRSFDEFRVVERGMFDRSNRSTSMGFRCAR